MSWLQLKFSMLPSISNEISTQIRHFHNLISTIDGLDEGEDKNEEHLQEYSKLRAQMKARMEELSVFYNDNLDDEKIQFFEKLRLKIKKALHNRPGK